MNIQVKQAKGVTFVKPLEKSIEAANSREFKSQIVDLINSGKTLIILNLSSVEFMDSSGLGSLISILKLLTNCNGKILVCEVGDQVARLFSLTRLDQIFHLFRKEDEAVNFLNIPSTSDVNG